MNDKNELSHTNRVMLPDGWKCTFVRTYEEMEVVRPIWEQVLAQETFPAPQAEMDWHKQILEITPDKPEPRILLLEKKGQCPVLLVGRLEKHPILFKIGYCIFARPRLTCLTLVYGGLLGGLDEQTGLLLYKTLVTLLKRKEMDLVLFNYEHEDSPVYMAIQKHSVFLQRKIFFHHQQHWRTRIPSSEEQISELLSKKHRRELDRCTRNLEKESEGKLKFVCYRHKNDLSLFIKAASTISDRTYQKGIGVGFEANSMTCRLLEYSQSRGQLRAYLLFAGEKPIAFEFGYVYRDCYFAVQAGYDPRWRKFSPGMILQMRIFGALCTDDGIYEYDYGVGDAAYKQRLGTHSWPEVRAYLFAPRIYPFLISLSHAGIQGVNHLLTIITKKIKLYDFIKRFWRRKAEKAG